MYRKLIELHKKGKVSFQYVATFNMDEYVDLPRDHCQSYHYFMFENFFKYIDINPKNVHILDGNAADLKLECSNYEEKIKEMGGIHLFIGGKNTNVGVHNFHFGVTLFSIFSVVWRVGNKFP
jgi:glucosamine-6-phosphate deaminase